MSSQAALGIAASSVVEQEPAAELRIRTKHFDGGWTTESGVEEGFAARAKKGKKAVRRAALYSLLPCAAALLLTSCTPAPRPLFEGPIDDQAKVEYLRKYAPQVRFHSKEAYWPSSVEWSFRFLKRHWRQNTGSWWLETKQPLKAPSSVLAYFHGADPKRQWTGVPLSLEEVPAYAFWHRVDDDTVDLVYFFYYPYNRGKEVVNTIFGSHVGDWEHVTVRLSRRQDGQGLSTLWSSLWWSRYAREPSFYLAAHSHGAKAAWIYVAKVRGTEHPIIYAAWGSHGSYLKPGNHKYGSAAGKALVDRTNEGTAWDTWKSLECFDYDAKRGLGPTWQGTWPKWLEKDTRGRSVGNEDPASGPVTKWGNYRAGAVRKYLLFGEKQYRLEHGPTGPADKPYFRTPALD